MPTDVFAVGWRPVGSAERRWTMRVCAGPAEAAAVAAGLARSDGGGRWRVYGTRAAPAAAGPPGIERAELLAEGVELPPRGGDE